MDPYASGFQRNQLSTVIDPYYSRGDVFQRDQRYYQQTPSTIRRSRTPNKSYVPIDNNSGYIAPPPVNPSPNSSSFSPVNPNPNQSTYIQSSQQEQLLRLRQQNKKLTEQLQKLTYGGQFGTGDTVIKMNHYTASKAENEQIRQQQRKIRELQELIKKNNQKLLKYQKASNQLEIRINNIQSIDKEIYKQLKSASTRDKELLERASAALSRGETKESVLRILEQIVLN